MRRGISTVLGVVGALAAAAPASAATAIGLASLPDPVNADACTATDACTVTNLAASPIDGVVTSWRVRASDTETGGTDVRLKVIRPADGGYTGVSTSPTQHISSSGTVATYGPFLTRQPIKTGDQIALDISPSGDNLAVDTDGLPRVTRLRWEPPLANSETKAPSAIFTDNELTTFNAVVEPDADCDGLGDESQDPAVVGGCLIPPSSGEPDTSLGRSPKKVVKTKHPKAKVKFTFSSNDPAAVFLCKLDKGKFRRCKSPFKRKVRRGKHVFLVEARNAAGNVDQTPARFKFRVRKR
jgi:hypothetical protein